MPKRKTTEEFIIQAKEVHGDKYDYSKTVYVTDRRKLYITCPIHGDFLQRPGHHLDGMGCVKCSGYYSPNTEEWISKAREVHGDKYDYSKVNYINNYTKVCIICPEHGEFWQIPTNHVLHKHGCKKCATKQITNTTEQFIEHSKQIHGDKYDYSKVNYVNAYTKVCIVCPEHGDFWQKPNSHLNGYNCPICSGHYDITTEEFINRAKKIHGNKYDYSKVDYKGTDIKVCIICPKHGEFWQTPHNHLNNKAGCPLCNTSKGELLIKNFLEKNNIPFEKQKRFKDCRDKYPLIFDFYLPEHNLCIEYQGYQHYYPLNNFGGTPQFESQIKRDNIKREWCSKESNPELLEISYLDFNNIQEILSLKLNLNGDTE